MERIKKLLGYSGCRLYLYSNRDTYFVRKYSKNEEYNLRLNEQIEKQKLMFSISNGSFKLPKIFKIGKAGRLLYFDMEYIKGEIALYYINSAMYYDIGKILDKIFATLLKFRSQKDNSCKDIYIESKNKSLDIFERVNMDSAMRKKIIRKLILLKRCRIPNTLCHGDLTFENIIVDKNKDIFFIDTHDSYYNSYWFDIAKLFQNIETDSYKINNMNLDIPLAKKDFILKKLDEFCRKTNPDYYKVHAVLSMLNFLRMLPYAKNFSSFSAISERIEYYLGK